jgi:subtilisin family serine protease
LIADDDFKGHCVYYSGININHTDFGGRAVWGITTVESSADQDDNGHGTFVAGIIGGSLFGVAKKVRLIAVKVRRESTYCWSRNVTECPQH